MDLHSVSYEDLERELKRRKAISSKSSGGNDDIMDIIEAPTKVSKEAVEDERKKALEEEKRQLEDEIRRKEIELQVMQFHMKVDRDMEEMEKEHRRMRAEAKPFNEECDRRIAATSTNEQLSLFPWFSH